jgi:hypothetical protein
MMGAIREEFWIVDVRSHIRRLIKTCIPSRKRNARLLTLQMANLPSERITPFEPVFNYTGTDCFGRVTCKVSRREQLYYGVIFMCMNVKAIHIELVKSLSTDEFICALMRFVALRGPVKRTTAAIMWEQSECFVKL